MKYQLYVVYADSHFVLMQATSEEKARSLNGIQVGHYLSSEAAHKAKEKHEQRLRQENSHERS